MATCSSILAWKIPRTEESGEVQSMGSQRARHDRARAHRRFTMLCQVSGIRKAVFLLKRSVPSGAQPVNCAVIQACRACPPEHRAGQEPPRAPRWARAPHAGHCRGVCARACEHVWPCAPPPSAWPTFYTKIQYVASYCVFWRKWKSLSRVRLFVAPRTVALQAPPSMGYSRQEHWSGLPCPPPGDLPNPGIEPGSPALQADSWLSEPPGIWDVWGKALGINQFKLVGEIFLSCRVGIFCRVKVNQFFNTSEKEKYLCIDRKYIYMYNNKHQTWLPAPPPKKRLW